MNIYVINNLFFGFSAFLISILILLKRQDEVAKRWFYFGISVTIYALAYGFQINGNLSEQDALFAARIANSGSAIIPAAWLYFICGFLGVQHRKTLLVACFIVWLLLLSAPTPLLIPFVAPAHGFSHYVVPGPIFHLHAINFFAVVAYGFYLMVRSYLEKSRSNEQRREILMLVFATIFGFIGGSSQYSLIYLRDKGIDLSLLLSTFPFIMAYVMIRHRVLDIEKLADAFQREKLAAVGILAASMNHEIKNPLYVARGTLESCLENAKDGLYQNGEESELLRKAAQASILQIDRAMEIMRRFMEFAKPSGRREEKENVPLREIFSRILELVGFQFNLQKIRVIQAIDGDIEIFGSPRELEEIFFNLIMNACQAMGEKGELRIEAERNRGVEIRITDTGPGIPQDKVRRLFQPFQTTKETGTGLGLYITKQLVERNGGKIRFESSPKGTSFILSFKLPINPKGLLTKTTRSDTDEKEPVGSASSSSWS